MPKKPSQLQSRIWESTEIVFKLREKVIFKKWDK